MSAPKHLLTINGGSSSLKFAVFTRAADPKRTLAAKVDRIGLSAETLEWGLVGQARESRSIEAKDHSQALAAVIDRLTASIDLEDLAAVGHRVVHGGTRYTEPQFVSPEMIAELRRLSPLDPEHLPAEIAMIEAMARVRADLPQVACFDTAFHATKPRVAQLLAIPRQYEASGVRRYGFHGLSYEYLMEELARTAGAAAKGRVILAHLGNGASLAAVRGGRCIDTSMGFTPTSGIPMGTRTGDLDPGVLVYLMRREGWSADDVDDLVNRRSGLLGVSGVSSDVRELLACRADRPEAADAVALFCYQTKRWIGSLAAALGGLETLVFSGGIGEHAGAVRAEICDGLEFLGIRLDPARNGADEAVISASESDVTVRVLPTDEEMIIARTICRMLERELTSI